MEQQYVEKVDKKTLDLINSCKHICVGSCLAFGCNCFCKIYHEHK